MQTRQPLSPVIKGREATTAHNCNEACRLAVQACSVRASRKPVCTRLWGSGSCCKPCCRCNVSWIALVLGTKTHCASGGFQHALLHSQGQLLFFVYLCAWSYKVVQLIENNVGI